MATYGSTGNTLQYGGIDSSVVSSFTDSLPPGQKGTTVSEVGGTSGASSSPATKVVVVDAGSDVSIDATQKSYILVGDNSTVDFSSSMKDNGKSVSLDITVSGGNNQITLNKGPDHVQSTTGNDTITSGGGHDTIIGGSGNDVITGGGNSSIVGGTGKDTLVGGLTSAAHDTIVGGANDTITTAFGNNLITGTNGDKINAGQAQDTIFANSGRETVTGGSGSYIYGSGHTSITGGDGNIDQLMGHDTYVGGQHADTIFTVGNSQISVQGGAGHLDVDLGAGKAVNDTLFGGSGGLTAHLSKAFGHIASEHLDKHTGITTITFSGGEVLHVHNVTLDFNGHSYKF